MQSVTPPTTSVASDVPATSSVDHSCFPHTIHSFRQAIYSSQRAPELTCSKVVGAADKKGWGWWPHCDVRTHHCTHRSAVVLECARVDGNRRRIVQRQVYVCCVASWFLRPCVRLLAALAWLLRQYYINVYFPPKIVTQHPGGLVFPQPASVERRCVQIGCHSWCFGKGVT